MDNPQNYQPLSAALHPPRSNASTYGQSTIVFDPSGRPVHENAAPSAAGGSREEEEEDEDEHEDEDDEGVIEKELNPRREGGPEHEQVHGHHPPSSVPAAITQPHTVGQGVLQQQPPERRRPGRPRGSKNRKNRAAPGSAAGPGAPQPAAATSLPPLPAHADISPQNREYYEFQWKVLHLCREFYEAAEQLVKSTHPLVIAQCYGMGPACKVDPIVMLAESKAVCDALMANPSQLVSNPHPPPPMYPIMPTFYSSNPAANTTPGASTSRQSTALPPSAVITNPQSFVVPLGIHPSSGAFPPPPFGVYGAPPPPAGGQYATPYYGFPPYGHPAPYYHPGASSSSSAQPAPQPAAAVSTSSALATSNGPWTDEQVSRLKELVEEAKGGDGQIDWDHVEKNLPGGRSRHQILIKATALGLKENTSRAAKRPRRDQDQGDSGTPMSSLASGTQQQQQQRLGSPHSQPASTPSASPALQNVQRPPSTSASNGGGTGQAGAANPRTTTPGTWAVTTPATQASSTSTGMLHSTPSSGAQDPQRTSYYRPRPTSTSSKSASEQIHHYQYVPNGRSGRESSG